MSDKYKVIALVGPSGCGKDTILNKVLGSNPEFQRVVSYTSRPMRETEKDGIAYHFTQPENFLDFFNNNTIVETAVFNDWFYGTTYDCYSKEKINIGVYDPTRLEILLSNPQMDVVVYYVQARDNTRLIRQLSREDNPDIDEIFRRFKADRVDFCDIEEICPDIIYLPNNTPDELAIALEIVASEQK